VQTISRGDGVVVAVIDSGVEIHPDLAGQVLTGQGFGSAASLSAQQDVDGHGTAMAGLIAAKGGGENDVLGIAPGSKILPLRVSSTSVAYGDVNTDGAAIVAAIRWAADHGATVINISLAASGSATDEQKAAIAYALSKDVVVIVGAGNSDTGQTSLGKLALVPGVIVVGATDRSGLLWSGSITGPEVTLTAPGVQIVSTASRAAGSKSGFTIGDGTSNSTAIVSGAAALIRAKYPTLKAPDVINRLITTADDAGPTGRDSQYGYGRLNIQRALTADVAHVERNPLLPAETATPTTPHTPASASSTGGNPLTGKALLGLIVFGLLLLSPIVLIVRRRLRAKKLMHAAGQSMPSGPQPQTTIYPQQQPPADAAPPPEHWPPTPPSPSA